MSKDKATLFGIKFLCHAFYVFMCAFFALECLVLAPKIVFTHSFELLVGVTAQDTNVPGWEVYKNRLEGEKRTKEISVCPANFHSKILKAGNFCW